MLLWWNSVVGNTESYVGHNVKSPVFLSDFSQIRGSWQIFVEVLDTKFHRNQSSGSRAETCGQTDGHDEANTHSSRVSERAYKDYFRYSLGWLLNSLQHNTRSAIRKREIRVKEAHILIHMQQIDILSYRIFILNVFSLHQTCTFYVIRTTSGKSLLHAGNRKFDIKGGSNMTGTNCDLFTHKSSRSYLNHLVHNKGKNKHTYNFTYNFTCVFYIHHVK